MRSVQLLGIILGTVIIISSAMIIFKGDTVLKKEYFIEPPSQLVIREVDVKPVDVTSARLEINITAYINNMGGKTKNASMLLRAINIDNGLLTARVSTPVPEIESGKSQAVSRNLAVDRDGGYELKILLFDNGSIRDSGSVTIRGLSALTPASKRSGIVLNNIDFTVSSTAEGKVEIKSDIYLENKGQEASENLKMIVKAKEAASNLLADKKISETGVIASEATSVVDVRLSVPDEYNYMVIAELWRGNVLVNTWEKPVLLAPAKTVPAESVEKKVDIDVSKFEREEGREFPSIEAIPPEGTPEEPGFEVISALIAFAGIIALRRRAKW